ncbi:YheC/YheD family protein [Paenibacillus sp. CC-CFT747]|nr:YheC/YheD family protein [Paenibacillus sp. CC-CFT747]
MTTALGIMALYVRDRAYSREELPYFRKLITEGRRLGLDVFLFTPEDVRHEERRIHASRLDPAGEWYREWVPMPRLVFDRCRYQSHPRFRLMRQFRARYPEILYLNRPLAHKWGNHVRLSKDPHVRRHLPETRHYQSRADLDYFLKKYPVVYLKPRDGTGGRGIASIRRRGNGLYLLQGRDPRLKILRPAVLRASSIPGRLKDWGLQKKYLVQQGIDLELEDGRVHDYRLLIQKNGNGEWEVTGGAGRIGAKRSVTSNIHGGGRAVPCDQLLRSRFSAEKAASIRASMDRLCHSTVRQLEKHFGSMCEMALDIAVDPEGKTWLLEVNPKPAREVFRLIGEEETYRRSITRPLEYALWLSRNRA